MAEAKKLKSVAIIGAGPSSLISAHHLLTSGNFSTTIFEKGPKVGGLWPISKNDDSRMIDPLMRANQSRHTVQFGAAGQRLYAAEGKNGNDGEDGEDGRECGKGEGEEEVDIFPKAWEVGRYLQSLAEEVKAKGVEFEMDTEVVGVEKVEGGKDRWEDEGRVRIYDEGMRWRVRTRKTSKPAEEKQRVFDFVVVASGFFGTPKIPENLRQYLSTTTPFPPSSSENTEQPTAPKIDSPLGIPVIHSSSFRSLAHLLSTTPSPAPPPPASKRKILVIGGSMSGTEIASSIASSLSSLTQSPTTSALPNPSNYEIIHIATRPFYTLSRYLPLDVKDGKGAAPDFLPCDLVFNNLVKRRGTKGDNNAGEMSMERAEMVHGFYQGLSGQRRPHAWVEGVDSVCDAPWLAICDDYTTHVLSSNITVKRGRLVGLQRVGAKDGSVSTVISTPAGDEILDDVCAVILATGFSSTHSLSFLSSAMKEKLEYIPDSYSPLGISWHSTISRKFPTLGFVGMYNGPFWGVMEQQALLLTSLWSRFCMDPEERKVEEDEVILVGRVPYLGNHAAGVRDHVEYPFGGEKNKEAWRRLSQFPMGDYVFTMTDLLSLRGMRLDVEGYDNNSDDGEIPKEGCYPLVPDGAEVREYLEDEDPRYVADVANLKTSPARLAVQSTVEEGLAGRFYPRNLFRALLGKWKLNRKITSKHPSYPSGTLTGSATFYPRAPTDPTYSGEYLYDESGDFITSTGLTMRASRRYVWRLQTGKGEEVDKLSQWFVKVSGPEKNLGVDYLFHELDIMRPDGRPLGGGEGGDGGACPMTKRAMKEVEDEEEEVDEVRGGWAPKAKTADKSTQQMGGLKIEDGKKEKRDGKEEGLWTARGHHLCIDDTYDPEYVFRWKGAELEEWTMGYTVKGPGKDYYIESRFTRER